MQCPFLSSASCAVIQPAVGKVRLLGVQACVKYIGWVGTSSFSQHKTTSLTKWKTQPLSNFILYLFRSVLAAGTTSTDGATELNCPTMSICKAQ